MTLQAPILDKRRFADLVDEARARIPRYTPEWTNFNDSDPGMTLVQLHAWMTETILYELNRVPELNYIKFLDLIGVKQRPAQPALTDLKFTLDKLAEPSEALVVPVPKNTKVAVDDPDLSREVVFETDRSLLALNAEIGAVFAYPIDEEAAATSGADYQLVTDYDDALDWPHSFYPFDPATPVNSAMYLGLLLRPNAKPPLTRFANDALPAGPLSLFVDTTQVLDIDPQDQLITGPLSTACPNETSPLDSPGIQWQIFTGTEQQAKYDHPESSTGWTTLALSRDDTVGLTRSGQIVLELPAGATAIDPVILPADDLSDESIAEPSNFWEEFGQPKPPQTQTELLTMLSKGSPEILAGLADFWEAMGLVDPDDILAFAACAESINQTIIKIEGLDVPLEPSALTIDDWVKVSDAFDIALPQAEDNYRRLYWLRARVIRELDSAEKPAAIRAMHLNSVSATQGATRLEEQLGRANGRPSQQFTLPKTPVMIDPKTGAPDFELSVSATGETDKWTLVSDFFESEPDSTHYLLDPDSGTITSGDGRRGRIPVANDRVTAVRYRVGGGLIGNVAKGVVSKIKGRVRNVKSCTNFRPAHDGSNAETLENVKLRAPHDLRARDRAVSARDFADLAMQTRGVNLHGAWPLAHTAVTEITAPGQRGFEQKDGAVTLIILPNSEDQAPQPSEEQLNAVCEWLAPRRLITTELYVTGPNYARITDLTLTLTIREDYDITNVKEQVYAELLSFVHPITGGRDQRGWPFGEDIFYGDLYDLVLGIDGVRRAMGLSVSIDGSPGDSSKDVAELDDGYLPELTRDAINLVASYA